MARPKKQVKLKEPIKIRLQTSRGWQQGIYLDTSTGRVRNMSI